MPKCSPEYMALVKTRTGLTPDKPWSSKFGINLPNVQEYEEWRVRAIELVEAVNEKVNFLADVKRARNDTESNERFLQWKAVVNEMQSLRNRVDALGNPAEASAESLLDLDMFWTSDTDEAIKISVDAVCLMEIVDAQLRELGAEPPPGVGSISPGGKPSSGGSVVGTLVALAVAGGVIYGVVRLSRGAAEAPAVEGV